MINFFRVINLIPAIRAIIAEETLLPKNNKNKFPFMIKILKYILFVKDNRNRDLSLTLKKLGPTWIKLGQFLATRPDIIGLELSSKLKTLQDKVEPFPKSKTIEILQNEFKDDYQNIFIDILPSETAASIAQVHKGVITLYHSITGGEGEGWVGRFGGSCTNFFL